MKYGDSNQTLKGQRSAPLLNHGGGYKPVTASTAADRARSTLKVTLSRLRSKLGDNSLIVATQNGYTLAVDPALDIGSFLNHAQIPELIPARIQLEAARERLSRLTIPSCREVQSSPSFEKSRAAFRYIVDELVDIHVVRA